MPRRARAGKQLGFAGAGMEAWAPWLSSWLADGRELASGMGRGGPEWERVVLRSGGHALIASPAAPGTNAMGHRRTHAQPTERGSRFVSSVVSLLGFIQTFLYILQGEERKIPYR